MHTDEWFPGSLDTPMSEKAKRILQFNKEYMDKFREEINSKDFLFESARRCGKTNMTKHMFNSVMDNFIKDYHSRFGYFSRIMPEVIVLSKCKKPSKVKKYKKLVKYLERQLGVCKNVEKISPDYDISDTSFYKSLYPEQISFNGKIEREFVLSDGKLVEVAMNTPDILKE